MVVKEAAACNVPVVSTPVGFVPTVLSDVENAAVRSGADGLADELAAVLASDCRSNGRAVVGESLSVDRMGASIEGVYDRVLEKEIHA